MNRTEFLPGVTRIRLTPEDAAEVPVPAREIPVFDGADGELALYDDEAAAVHLRR